MMEGGRAMLGRLQMRMEKKLMKSFFYLLFPLFLVGLIVSASWSAEDTYPNRPINMVVPYAPGGGADLGSKVVADKIAQFLKQPIISVYKPGGGGSLGAAFVAGAKPDGYTVLVGSSTPLVLSTIVKKMDYKLGDFSHAGMYGRIPFWLAVKADARWKTLKEFVEDARKSPGQLKVGSYGMLTGVHFVIELLDKYAGIKLSHIPYKSSGEALAAVLGGHMDGAMVSGAGGLLESGQVRILAAAEEERLEGLPDVATFKEFGYPIVLCGQYSMSFPKATPKEIVYKFSKAQEKAFQAHSKEIKEGLRRVEIWATFYNPEETMKRFQEEYTFLYKIAEELGAVAK